MESSEVRKRFLEFFAARGHAVMPSSSLIPDDPSVLLTTAGMQQFKKYYTGEVDPLKDFGSKNAASVQKSFRMSDIDEVGDETHLTFFEMLGNFSFGYKPGEAVSPQGGYFKGEAIKLAHDFFASVNLPIQYVTVFEGDAEVPADQESEEAWRRLGITDIRKRGRGDNFWGPTGAEGPCGPTTEIYVRDTEVWNIVFNQYYCRPGRTLEPLKQNGVDTGMGLERLAMVLQDKPNIFETDLFAPLLALLPGELDPKKKRVVADHLRAATFLLADGVEPANKGAGYVLRRLLRRVMSYEKTDAVPVLVMGAVVHEVIQQYGAFYPELLRERETIRVRFDREHEGFRKTLERGLKEFNKLIMSRTPDRRGTIGRFHDQRVLHGEDAFYLYQSFGFPREVMKDLATAAGGTFDDAGFDSALAQHQEVSRAGQEKKFGGHGLILDTGELKAASEEELKIVTRLHTATHLLNAALHRVLGDSVAQNGSDITAERTRFDFNFSRKLTPDELRKVEDLVNSAIENNLPVVPETLPLDEAKRMGALFMERSKYPDPVTVYTVGGAAGTFSKELCGGPHVGRTGEIGRFKILKEESSSAGVRRIRATVEPGSTKP